ncbi:MAG: acyl-CoA dehydrogenase [Desulfobacteraceae bacterium]|nr:MAG: acyl-CoA dehydrogenase [Desulfobacteraceae bacterium]
MDFNFSESQRKWRDLGRKFAQEVIVPRARELESSEEHPYDLVSQMAELGMMGIPFPSEYGGGDGDWVGTNLCIEELARADELPASILDVTVSGAALELFAFGTEEQKQRWLIPLIKGTELGSIGLTEPDAGSDAGSLRTTATLEGDEWVINGTKQFITNSGLKNTSIVIVAAKTERPTDGSTVICTIIVPNRTPGFEVGKKYDKMANNGISTRELFFDNCRVPKNYLLGDIDKGLSNHLTSLQTGRITVGAMSTGTAQGCLDAALSFLSHRYSGHKALFDNQTIPFKLADIAMRIELARNMYVKAAWLKDMNMEFTLEAHFAKLYASEIATTISAEVMRLISPYGYLEEYPVSRFFREAKLHEIVEGTSEMQRMTIARELFKRVAHGKAIS